MNYAQAADLLAENYGGHWADEDPEWWREMIDMLMEHRNVRQLRKAHPEWNIPRWWPGQPEHGSRAQGAGIR